jgi:hypothetical protein
MASARSSPTTCPLMPARFHTPMRPITSETARPSGVRGAYSISGQRSPSMLSPSAQGSPLLRHWAQ